MGPLYSRPKPLMVYSNKNKLSKKLCVSPPPPPQDMTFHWPNHNLPLKPVESICKGLYNSKYTLMIASGALPPSSPPLLPWKQKKEQERAWKWQETGKWLTDCCYFHFKLLSQHHAAMLNISEIVFRTQYPALNQEGNSVFNWTESQILLIRPYSAVLLFSIAKCTPLLSTVWDERRWPSCPAAVSHFQSSHWLTHPHTLGDTWN